MTDKPDTSADAVERLASILADRTTEEYAVSGIGTYSPIEHPDVECCVAAATLRALLAERDAARAERDKLYDDYSESLSTRTRVAREEIAGVIGLARHTFTQYENIIKAQADQLAKLREDKKE